MSLKREENQGQSRFISIFLDFKLKVPDFNRKFAYSGSCPRSQQNLGIEEIFRSCSELHPTWPDFCRDCYPVGWSRPGLLHIMHCCFKLNLQNPFISPIIYPSTFLPEHERREKNHSGGIIWIEPSSSSTISDHFIHYAVASEAETWDLN